MFTIECTYTHGDSFGTEEDVENLPLSWDTMEQARVALNALKEHHKACHQYEILRHSEERDAFFDKLKKKDWFPVNSDQYMWMTGISLETKTGEKQHIQAFWNDFFGRLIKAKVVIDPESESGSNLTYFG